MKDEYIKTFDDLIKVIKKYNLENKNVVVGCEGYISLYEGQACSTRLLIDKSKNFAIICDECGAYEEELTKEAKL